MTPGLPTLQIIKIVVVAPVDDIEHLRPWITAVMKAGSNEIVTAEGKRYRIEEMAYPVP